VRHVVVEEDAGDELLPEVTLVFSYRLLMWSWTAYGDTSDATRARDFCDAGLEVRGRVPERARSLPMSSDAPSCRRSARSWPS
jgi:hypothetical protein